MKTTFARVPPSVPLRPPVDSISTATPTPTPIASRFSGSEPRTSAF
ncbi:MAG: hypothetical protein IJE77_03700 [Thermoguttaceae bacterium]|nr:hypothetical protein [Thermoguttaceae bacterium]MBQ9801356.1 hypothetical protein [Thermoguttaceae bacterium]